MIQDKKIIYTVNRQVAVTVAGSGLNVVTSGLDGNSEGFTRGLKVKEGEGLMLFF